MFGALCMSLFISTAIFPGASYASDHVEVGEQVLMTDEEGHTYVGVVTSSGEASLVVADAQGRSIERRWTEIESVSPFVVPPTHRERVRRREAGILGRVPLVWAEAGFGLVPVVGGGPFVYHLGAYAKWKHWPLFHLRHVSTSGLGHGHARPLILPDEYSDETAFLAVSRATGRFGTASAGFGLSWVHGMRRGRYLYSVVSPTDGEILERHYARDRFRTVGLAAELNATWTPSRFWGLGLTVLGDANLERPFWGVVVGIQLGHVTRRH